MSRAPGGTKLKVFNFSKLTHLKVHLWRHISSTLSITSLCVHLRSVFSCISSKIHLSQSCLIEIMSKSSIILLSLVILKLAAARSIISKNVNIFSTPSLNNEPIIGILSEEMSYYLASKFPNEYHSYIAASYVKFVEGGGARVVPIWWVAKKYLLCACSCQKGFCALPSVKHFNWPRSESLKVWILMESFPKGSQKSILA